MVKDDRAAQIVPVLPRHLSKGFLHETVSCLGMYEMVEVKRPPQAGLSDSDSMWKWIVFLSSNYLFSRSYYGKV